MSETQRQFAYGKDTVGSCECPALQAGFSPSSGDESTRVAEWYDSMVSELGYTNMDSIIAEKEAKDAWLETINEIRTRYPEGSETIQVAEEIAKELGWK